MLHNTYSLNGSTGFFIEQYYRNEERKTRKEKIRLLVHGLPYAYISYPVYFAYRVSYNQKHSVQKEAQTL